MSLSFVTCSVRRSFTRRFRRYWTVAIDSSFVGNLVALASLDPSQIETLKQPFIQSLFNVLDACRQRQTADEQSGKPTKATSIWHPIIGHVRGKTNGMTVFVHSSHICSLHVELCLFIFDFQIQSRTGSACHRAV